MLTDKAIKAAAAKNKPYKIADGNGLFLHVSQKGHKTFRFKFRFDKKEQLLIIGVYPEMSLADARERRNDARKLLREGREKIDIEPRSVPQKCYKLLPALRI